MTVTTRGQKHRKAAEATQRESIKRSAEGKEAEVEAQAELVAAARSAFEALDANGNGLLEEEELSQLVETLASHEDEVLSTAKMMKILDTDGSGQIMYDHFEAWWLEQNKKKRR